MDGILHRNRGLLLAHCEEVWGIPRALSCSLVLLWITSALSCSVPCIQVDCLRGMQFFRKADSAGAQGDFKLEWTQWLESDWLPSPCEAGTVRLSEEKGFLWAGVCAQVSALPPSTVGCAVLPKSGQMVTARRAHWQITEAENASRGSYWICVRFLKGNNSQFLGAKLCFSELLISMFCGCSIFTFLPYNNVMRKPIPHWLVS